MKKLMVFIMLLMSAGLCETASAADVELAFILPAVLISPGQPFHVELSIDNDGPEYAGAQLFVALTVGTGDYWFYPSWVKYPDDIDFEVMDIAAQSGGRKEIIPEFDWPLGVGEFSGAEFLAAVLYDGRLISNIAEIRFGWTELIRMDTGSFQMGSPEDEMCREADETLHTVILTKEFSIQATEVRQLQWKEIFGENPSYFKGDDKPVENITWYDAIAYCNRLSIQLGLMPCYYSDSSYTEVFDGDPPIISGTVYWKEDADGYRLPTEAEWEYACRAGTTTAYNSGEDNTDCEEDPELDPLGWYYYNSDTGNGQETHDAGLKQPNNWGLYDMHGNVWEWCWDWYGDYPEATVTNPTGPAAGSYHVGRGGSWDKHAGYCRSANRTYVPDYNYCFLGLRICRSAETESTPTPPPTYTPTPPPAPTGFVYIPPGTFQMGSPGDEMCREADETLHPVTLTKGFYIQLTEVIQSEWESIFGENPSHFQGENRPVEMITWYDAVIYCNRLSIQQGLTPCYYSDSGYTEVFDGVPPVETGTVYWKEDADGYRLPTEAEWEYACRAGTTTAYNSGNDNTSCWSEDINLNPLGWYFENAFNRTHEAGLKQPNNWGLYDMHGNLIEWCWDWYGDYPEGTVTDPTGPDTGSDRITRGGGWINIARYCRSANRYYHTPDYSSYNVGFRVCLSAE